MNRFPREALLPWACKEAIPILRMVRQYFLPILPSRSSNASDSKKNNIAFSEMLVLTLKSKR